MDFNICLNNIQKQFNYDNEIMNYIKLAFKALLNYYKTYGNYSGKIYKMFMTTRIVPYNISLGQYEEKENLMRKYSDKTEEDIRNHCIQEVGELLYKKINNKIVKTVIIKKENEKIQLETLVHELIHSLVTSDEIQKEEYKTYIKSGLSIENIEPVEYINNHFIEEGMTEYDAIMACNSINYETKISDNYYPLYDYAKAIMDDNYINNIITRSRLDGINYIEQIKNIEFKDILTSYINNFESIWTNKKERNELIELNKNKVQIILNQKTI